MLAHLVEPERRRNAEISDYLTTPIPARNSDEFHRYEHRQFQQCPTCRWSWSGPASKATAAFEMHRVAAHGL